jgi:hypothetical protein
MGESVQNENKAQSENKERWQILCAQVAAERDAQKLLLLVRELSKVLKEREERPNGPHKASKTATSAQLSDSEQPDSEDGQPRTHNS